MLILNSGEIFGGHGQYYGQWPEPVVKRSLMASFRTLLKRSLPPDGHFSIQVDDTCARSLVRRSREIEYCHAHLESNYAEDYLKTLIRKASRFVVPLSVSFETFEVCVKCMQ